MRPPRFLARFLRFRQTRTGRPILALAHSSSTNLSVSSSFSSLALSSSFPSVPKIRRKSDTPIRRLTHLLVFMALLTLFVSDRVYNAYQTSLEPIVVTGQALHPSPSPTQRSDTDMPEITFRGTVQHPVGVVALHLLNQYKLGSLLDFPCQAHRKLSSAILKLHVKSHGQDFQYVCADTDSSQLSISHIVIRKAVPQFTSTRYTRLAKISRMPQADLLLHWRNGAEDDINKLREVILAARAAGVRMAIIGAKPMPFTSFTPEYELVTKRTVRFMKAGVYGHAPFPFANAIMTISGAYAKDRMLLVYDLNALPDVSGRREHE